MNSDNLLAWQWKSYPQYHAARLNLLIHLVAVPVFLVANAGLIVAALSTSVVGMALCVLFMLVSVGLQGFGHDRESKAPVPFSNFPDAVARILLEQWVNFPRYVLSGGWIRAYRGTP